SPRANGRGATTGKGSSSAAPLERHHDLVGLDAYDVGADAKLVVDEAPTGCDFELPLVPRTAHDARVAAERELAVLHLDRCRDPACAERRATVRAAVGECVQLSADAEEPDSVAVDLDHPDGSLIRRLVQRQPRIPLAPGAHAAVGTGSRKKRCAFCQRTPSRHAAGSWRSVWSGSSKSQCGKSLAYISVSHGRRNSIAAMSCSGSSGDSSGCVAKRTCSQTYSDGRRRHHGISLRHAFQFVSSRQRKPTNGTSPPSTIATRVWGNRSKMPWQRIETRCPYMPEPQSVWYSA